MSHSEPYVEEELLVRIAAGDELAFSRLFHHYLFKIKPGLDKLGISPTAVKEIIQETFIKIWLHREKLPAIENLPGYIYTTAINEFRQSLRKSLVQQKTKQHYYRINSRHSQTYSLEGGLEAKEITAFVDKIVRDFPEKRKLIYQMNHHQGLSIAEIAVRLKISPRTVRNTLQQAMMQIRSGLAAAGIKEFILVLPLLI